jgi:hypothetical protein
VEIIRRRDVSEVPIEARCWLAFRRNVAANSSSRRRRIQILMLPSWGWWSNFHPRIIFPRHQRQHTLAPTRPTIARVAAIFPVVRSDAPFLRAYCTFHHMSTVDTRTDHRPRRRHTAVIIEMRRSLLAYREAERRH